MRIVIQLNIAGLKMQKTIRLMVMHSSETVSIPHPYELPVGPNFCFKQIFYVTKATKKYWISLTYVGNNR